MRETTHPVGGGRATTQMVQDGRMGGSGEKRSQAVVLRVTEVKVVFRNEKKAERYRITSAVVQNQAPIQQGWVRKNK